MQECTDQTSVYTLTSESFGGMESEPMLTPREKSPLSKKFTSEESGTHNAASSRTASPAHYQRAIPASFFVSESGSFIAVWADDVCMISIGLMLNVDWLEADSHPCGEDPSLFQMARFSQMIKTVWEMVNFDRLSIRDLFHHNLPEILLEWLIRPFNPLLCQLSEIVAAEIVSQNPLNQVLCGRLSY